MEPPWLAEQERHLASEASPCADDGGPQQRTGSRLPNCSLSSSHTSTDTTTGPREVQLTLQAPQSNRLDLEVRLQRLQKPATLLWAANVLEIDNAERYWLEFVQKTTFPVEVAARRASEHATASGGW
ncbi:hypothetical protein MRX96_025571 [Rhipicephalus microplus]